MTGNWNRFLLAVLPLALGLGACSGSGSSGSVAEGGIGGTGISMGSVAEIGSVKVNGVKYDTTGATISLVDEDREWNDSDGDGIGKDISLGMIVRVEGSKSADGLSGTATRVIYADNLEGPIDEVDAIINPNMMVVLGQTVIVDNLTLDAYGNPLNGVASFKPGEIVEVSGHLDANGNIRATYIEKTGSGVLELKGWVDSVSVPYSFTINGLSVDTSAIGQEVGDLQGQFVEVVGSSYSNGVLVAASVELGLAALSTDDYDEAELSGIVTREVSAGEFMLGGQLVRHDGDTEFNGGLAAEIVPGVRLKAEGCLSGGVLLAQEIEFEDGIELAANILLKDEASHSIELDGLVDAAEVNVRVRVDDLLTEFEGAAGSFAELQAGQHVELRARQTSGGLLATKLSAAETADSALVLQGPVEQWDEVAATVRVLGVDAELHDPDLVSYEIDGRGTVSEAEFFDALVEGDLVELEGSLNGGTADWDSIELDK
ncbi:MAG TPA: DUF5666 domain-containing protein [Gammaproteobacteria bacterium]